jgi:signal peptidase
MIKMKKSDAVLAVVLAIAAFIFISSRAGTSTYLVVLSESMKPTINMGDLVVTTPTNPNDIKTGDIIAFKNGNAEIPVTHRVVNVTASGFVTKGDANDDADIQVRRQGDVLGRIAFWIPFAGYFVYFARSIYGFIILIIIPGLLLIILEARKLIGYAREGKKKKTTIKSLAMLLIPVVLMSASLSSMPTTSFFFDEEISSGNFFSVECPTPVCGRMTGGGSVFNESIRITHGFELHCNPGCKPNNLEINWCKEEKDKDGKCKKECKADNHFHLENLISAFCSDDPGISPNPPNAGFDTYVGNGTGRLNGVDGAIAEWTFTDAGEPGTKDFVKIVIKYPNGTIALSVSGFLDKGNQQAHKDCSCPGCSCKDDKDHQFEEQDVYTENTSSENDTVVTGNSQVTGFSILGGGSSPNGNQPQNNDPTNETQGNETQNNTDTISPIWSDNSISGDLAGTDVVHSVLWNDNIQLSGYIFSFDNCEDLMINDTWTPFTDNLSNLTKTINSTIGCTIRWKVYANDSSNNWNETEEFIYNTTGIVPPADLPPTWSNSSANSTLAGSDVQHSVLWTDDVQLSGYIFSFDNYEGSMTNETWVPFTDNWSNFTKTINSTVGCTINWMVYANDSSNKWNATEIFSYNSS